LTPVSSKLEPKFQENRHFPWNWSIKSSQYFESQFGKPWRESGNQWAFTYYLPNPIPPTFQPGGKR